MKHKINTFKTSLIPAFIAKLLLCLCLVFFCIMLLSSCNDKKTQDAEKTNNTPQIDVSLTLQGKDETLESVMDKIFVNFVWTPRKGNMQQDGIFPSVEEKRSQIAQSLSEAYRQNKTYSIQMTHLEHFLTLLNEWNKIGEWGALSDSGKTYERLNTLERLDTEIELSLGLLLLDYNNGDPKAFLDLLQQQFETAKGSGELNNIIETQIQARLLMLYGLQHLDVMHNTHNKHPVGSQTRDIVESDLQAYKDFLPKEHYEVYYRAFELLKIESLRNQVPMDFLALKITQFPKSMELSVQENEDMQNHLERFSASYEIFKARDFGSKTRDDIVEIAQNPLKNIYDNAKIANYQYGLDYLSLALLNDNVMQNIYFGMEYLQKDFKHFQIFEHYFHEPSFHNYICSMFFGAHILSIFKQNVEQFEELVRSIGSELTQYKDVISPYDFEFYQDALNMLEQVNRADFAHIELKEIKPKEEEGFIKVPLTLSPEEFNTLSALQKRTQIKKQDTNLLKETNIDEETSCLSVNDINFMLSLAYQALKSQGYQGISPDLFHIRLEELFGVEFIDGIAKESAYLIDFDNFLILGVANKHCFVQQLIIDELLFNMRNQRRICGQNVYFDKDRGFVLNAIAPNDVIEIMPDGLVYFRLRKSDIVLNNFLFRNNEDALSELKNSSDLSSLLAELQAFFPTFNNYLTQRMPTNEAKALLTKSQLKPCE